MSPDRFFLIQLLFFLVWLAALLWLPIFRPGAPQRPAPTVLALNGTLTGRVLSATTGLPVPGATLECRLGANPLAAQAPVARAVTPATGAYTMSIPPGACSVRFAAQGYETESKAVNLAPGTTQRLEVFLVPVTAPGTARVRLTWGVNPRDLDLHLVGPGATPQRPLHIFFASRRAPGTAMGVANLDRDDIDSYGPETMTVPLIDGTYRFFVHDYTNRGSMNSVAMAASGAVVEVYGAGGRLARFDIPPTSKGTLWTVLDLSTRNGTVTPIMTYQSEADASQVWKHATR